MRYSSIINNDFVNGEGISVSFWTQGCPEPHCPGCHNPQTWDFSGGLEFTPQTLDQILTALTAHGIKRNLSILGGEPLCQENLFLTTLVVKEVKEHFPNVKIYLWTRYLLEDLQKDTNPHLQYILETIDVLIDGPFVLAERDITLPLCGSRNQRILRKGKDF